jgi:hypothetical protein
MPLFSNKKQPIAPRRRQQAQSQTPHSAEGDLDKRYSFQRNRTLTGSASSRIAVVGESKAQLKSARVQAHELTRQRRHIGVVLLLVLCCAFLLFGLISQFTAGVVVKAEDVSVQLSPTYEQAIQSYLSSRPAERLRFLTDMERLSEYVQTKAPEVASVQSDGSVGFGESAFVVTMRQPIAGWSMDGHRQYVDSTGTAFSRNYFAPPGVQIVDDSGVPVQAGQAVASNGFLEFVGRAVGLSKTQGYKVTQVVIPEGTTREVELHLEGVAYPIKLSVDRPAGEQVEDMARAIKWFASHGQTPQYLDVRVSGRAFYR